MRINTRCIFISRWCLKRSFSNFKTRFLFKKIKLCVLVKFYVFLVFYIFFGNKKTILIVTRLNLKQKFILYTLIKCLNFIKKYILHFFNCNFLKLFFLWKKAKFNKNAYINSFLSKTAVVIKFWFSMTIGCF